MGWFTFFSAQVFLTSVTIGALKKTGVIRCGELGGGQLADFPPRAAPRPRLAHEGEANDQGCVLLYSKNAPFFPPHSVDPRKIDNPTLRSLFESAVGLGDEVAAKAEKLVKTVREAK